MIPLALPSLIVCAPVQGGLCCHPPDAWPISPSPADCRLVLEPDPVGPHAFPTLPLPGTSCSPDQTELSVCAPPALPAAPHPPRLPRPPHTPLTSRRALIRVGILTTFSLLGLGTGMTTAFAQRVLGLHPAGPMGTRPAASAPSASAPSALTPAPSVQPTLTRHTVFRHHHHPVRAVTWAPDERLLASGDDDGVVWVWRPDGSVLHALALHAPIRAVACSPDGGQLAVGGDRIVAFFDVHTPALLARRSASHTAPVTALGWTGTPAPQASPQGTPPLAVSASSDTQAIVWSASSHEPQVVFRQHTAPIEALTIQGEIVVTASAGGVARVWNARSGQELHGSYAPTQRPLRAATLSAQGVLALGGDDGVVYLWTEGRACTRQSSGAFGWQCLDAARSLHEPPSQTRQTGALRAVAFAPDGAVLASGGEDYPLLLWSVPTLSPLPVQPQQEALTAVAWSPSGRWLAVASGAEVTLWQLQEAGNGGHP
ncbi:MAG: hypothetical protein IMW89_13955 [Ktedonobacteraceae bacterium]|nr:hypothetical protein [Ktedonobacteraceae bacterium]